MPKPTTGMLKNRSPSNVGFSPGDLMGFRQGCQTPTCLKVFATTIRANASSRYEDNPTIPPGIKTASLIHLAMHWHTAHKELKAALRATGYVLDIKDLAETKTKAIEVFTDVPKVWVWDIISPGSRPQAVRANRERA